MSHTPDERRTGLEVQVIDWKDGERHVALFFRDFDQMLAMTADDTRKLAFLLMECADFIKPPFGPGEGEIDPNDNSESEEIFGPHDEVEEFEPDDEVEDDDSDDDDEVMS